MAVVGGMSYRCRKPMAVAFRRKCSCSPKTEDGGLLLPLSAADWVLQDFWNGFLECPINDGFCL